MCGHKYGVYCLLLSKSNKWLFSGSTDNTIGIWTCKSRKHERFLDAQKSTIVSLVLSQNENFLFSMSKNGMIFVWNLKTFKINNKIQHFSAPNSSLCFALSDPIYTIFGRDSQNRNSLRAMNLLSGETVKLIPIHKKRLRCMKLDHQNQFLYTGGTDGWVNVLDIATCEVVDCLQAHSKAVNCIAISKDDRYVATGSDDMTAKIFDSLQKYSQVAELKLKVEISFVLFSQNNKSLLVGGWNVRPIRIWDLRAMDMVEVKKGIDTPGQFFMIQSPYNWNRECVKTAQEKVKQNIVDFEAGMKEVVDYELTKTSMNYLKHMVSSKPGVSLNPDQKEKQDEEVLKILKNKKPIAEVGMSKSIPEVKNEMILSKEPEAEDIESSDMGSLAVSRKFQKTELKEEGSEGVTFKPRGIFKRRIIKK